MRPGSGAPRPGCWSATTPGRPAGSRPWQRPWEMSPRGLRCGVPGCAPSGSGVRSACPAARRTWSAEPPGWWPWRSTTWWDRLPTIRVAGSGWQTGGSPPAWLPERPMPRWSMGAGRWWSPRVGRRPSWPRCHPRCWGARRWRTCWSAWGWTPWGRSLPCPPPTSWPASGPRGATPTAWPRESTSGHRRGGRYRRTWLCPWPSPHRWSGSTGRRSPPGPWPRLSMVACRVVAWPAPGWWSRSRRSTGNAWTGAGGTRVCWARGRWPTGCDGSWRGGSTDRRPSDPPRGAPGWSSSLTRWCRPPVARWGSGVERRRPTSGRPGPAAGWRACWVPGRCGCRSGGAAGTRGSALPWCRSTTGRATGPTLRPGWWLRRPTDHRGPGYYPAPCRPRSTPSQPPSRCATSPVDR